MTTATESMSLAEEIRAHMTDDTGGDYENCGDCGEAVTAEYAGAHEGYCPRCVHRAAVESARDDVIVAREDLAGLLEEMAELKARIAEQRQALTDARTTLATLKARK